MCACNCTTIPKGTCIPIHSTSFSPLLSQSVCDQCPEHPNPLHLRATCLSICASKCGGGGINHSHWHCAQCGFDILSTLLHYMPPMPCYSACHLCLITVHATHALLQCMPPMPCYTACHPCLVSVTVHVAHALLQIMQPMPCYSACHPYLVTVHATHTLLLLQCVQPMLCYSVCDPCLVTVCATHALLMLQYVQPMPCYSACNPCHPSISAGCSSIGYPGHSTARADHPGDHLASILQPHHHQSARWSRSGVAGGAQHWQPRNCHHHCCS